MAPEQAQNAAARPAADLWALGATFFNATEDRPPYEGPDYVTVLLTLLTQDPPAPVRAGPLAPLITALLRRDPERRPSAEQAADQLAEVLREEPGGATAKAATTERSAIVPTVTEKPTAPSPPKTHVPAHTRARPASYGKPSGRSRSRARVPGSLHPGPPRVPELAVHPSCR